MFPGQDDTTNPSGSNAASAETASDSDPKEGWSLSAMWWRLKKLFGKRSKKTLSPSETSPPKQLELVFHPLESESTSTMQPENDGKTRIFCFVSGDSSNYDTLPVMYTACALTDQGRWIAGAVSQTKEESLIRVLRMAEAKAPTMLSTEFVVVAVALGDERLDKALSEAFRRMP